SRSAAVAILGELAVPGPAPDELRAPVLLVVSSDATVVAPQQIEELRRVLGEGLQVTTVAGGHNILWDGFEATAAAVSAFHDEATTPRKFSNAGDDDLILLVVGGKGGYVERDGHLVDPDDLPRRQAFSGGGG